MASSGLKISSVANEAGKTAADVLEEMNGLWAAAKAKWKEQKLTESDHKQLDEIYDSFRSAHPQLYSSYPTVVKHALMEMNYHPDAFRKYLKRLEVRPWLDDNQRLESYSDYAVLLYKALNPRRWRPDEMAAFRADYLDKLTTEHKKFEAMFKRHAEDIAREEKQHDRERREQLAEVLEQLRAAREAAKAAEANSSAQP